MNNKTIKNSMKEHRLKAGLTQLQVAKALGFSSTDRISRREAGLTYPHVKNLFKIAELYKVQAEKLYL